MINKKDIRKMIEEAGEDRVVQDKLIDLFCEFTDILEEKEPQMMKKIEAKMFDDGMGGETQKIDREKAEWIVNKIYSNNRIGKGERLFTFQKAEQLAKQHKIPMDRFTVEDWYITLVIAETDFKELLGTNMDNYVTYSKLWLMDKDAPHDGSKKLYDYLCYVAQVIDENEMYDSDNGMYRNGMNGRYNPYMRNRMINERNMMYHGNGMYDERRRYDNGYNRYMNRNYDNGNMYDNNYDERYDNNYDNRYESQRGRNGYDDRSGNQNREYHTQSNRRY